MLRRAALITTLAVALGWPEAGAYAGTLEVVRDEAEAIGFGGGPGHSGDDILLENAVDGTTTGRLELVQRAIGGPAGATLPGGAQQRGGTATNLLDGLRSTGELAAWLEAIGGEGADQEFGVLPSRGGDALAESAIANDSGPVEAYVYARGGVGGFNLGGLPGADGGDATVEAAASSMGDGHTVTVGGGTSLYGAVGGEGRLGSNFGGSVSGAGGDAVSRSIGTAAGNSRVTVRDRATGGLGSSGGAATSHAEGHNAGSQPVSVRAEAIGGEGGAPTGQGGIANATARGTSTTGNVEVSATQTNGKAKLGVNTGLDGLDSTMVDAVSGETAGTLTLFQHAVAGEGATGAPRGGAGGAARSELTASNPAEGALTVVVQATGGFGGSGQTPGGTTVGGDGGSAHAAATAETLGDAALSLTARAVGGLGRNAQHVAGDGGGATLGTVFGRSDTGNVTVIGEAIGGTSQSSGFSGVDASGGDGASVSLVDTVNGETAGVLTLVQRATGGAAGGVGTGANGPAGTAGSASSRLDRTVRARNLTIETGAFGGDGAQASIGTLDGGDAESDAEAINETGSVVLRARAEGGDAGDGYSAGSGLPGAGGDAVVRAFGQTHGDAHVVFIGAAFPTIPPGVPPFGFGAVGGAGGLRVAGHGGGGNASSTSEGIALGNSRVEVYDFAAGGGFNNPGQPPVGGGDAKSLAAALTAGSERALAHSRAIGGSAEIDSGVAQALASAHGLGEALATAEAQVANPTVFTAAPTPRAIAEAGAIGSSGLASAVASSASPVFARSIVSTQASASAPILTGAAANARAGATGILGSGALASHVDAQAIATGNRTQDATWGSAALVLEDHQIHDAGNIVLRSEASFSGTTTENVLAAGLFVSFLSVEVAEQGFEQLAFRVQNGTTTVLERTFDDAGAAIDFFAEQLLLSGLTSIPFSPGAFDLHLALELTSSSAGSRSGIVFTLGTTPVPEPSTAVLLVLGFIAIGAQRRRYHRV